MYDESEDRYCYPGISVLRNRFGHRTQVELDKDEKFFVAKRAAEPLPIGSFDYKHYRRIHRHLFRDVYSWAGRIRTVRIAKGGNWFCFPENIDREMRRLFDELAADNILRDLDPATFAGKATHFMAELNAIHPFREGSGRTQNIFLIILADQAGRPLDMQRLEPPEMLRAMVASFGGNEQLLADLILGLMRVR